MPRILIALVLLATAVFAQEPAKTAPNAATNADGAAGRFPTDKTKAAELMRASYYHPDELSALDCSVGIDWKAFLESGKMNVPEERLKLLEGLKVQSHAERMMSPTVIFDWSAGDIDTKDKMEGGMKQIVSGFYQSYWSMMATSPVNRSSDLDSIEALPDGGAKATSITGDITTVATVDREATPVHYTIDSPSMKATMDVHYTPTPNPVAGDLRRISEMDISSHSGESTMDVGLTLDYQDVSGIHVPWHVSYNIVGSFLVKLEFMNCKAKTRATTSAEAPKP